MLLTQIQADLKEALLARETGKVSCLRLLVAGIHNFQIERRKELTDEEVLVVIRRELKQRQESIAAYRQGGRSDLEAKERQEADILSKYLPQQISHSELEKLVKETIKEVGAAGPKDFGKVMGMIMEKVKGRADGNQVSQVVKKQLPACKS